jgi:altronate dehydratase
MSASPTFHLNAVARKPSDADNCAIAVRRLEAGLGITDGSKSFPLSHTVLEGHRFAVAPIAAGAMLTSWSLPFGKALKVMRPGDYVCNATMIGALHSRHVDFTVPVEPNFADHFQPYTLDERAFTPAEQVPLYTTPRTFMGYAREGGRGAGTRNHVVVLGTSSLTGSFARVLAGKFREAPQQFANVDGVVAIAHTEGGEPGQPNNLELTLRTLAGFLVNPNVGAVLALDRGTEAVNNDALRDWLHAHGYPLDAVPHRFFCLGADFNANLTGGARLVEQLLAQANTTARAPQPLRHLKIGMQCGGSDAFSGVSGNPIVGIITRELVRHGGSANLAETDELMGAEPYVLAKVRNLGTARKFLRTLADFEERLSWHGVSGQTNPSGGNIFRGLYNIAIKSIGAARKKDPAVRLDYVIDYAEPMPEPGFYFMNSPGNDLESIAGQVAAGCNLIVFTTGNGSITNHPFVPTVKVMTNTPRFELLRNEMDFNAGRYLDGEPLEALGAEAFDYTVAIASGQRSVGERAGHSQAQLWREWRQTSAKSLPQLKQRVKPSGEPLRLRSAELQLGVNPDLAAELQHAKLDLRAPKTRLIIPTSLCSGQVGQLIANTLNTWNTEPGVRYVALPHTEGCGVSGEAIQILEQTIAGYAVHPLSERTLLLEHGCEKTHNDAIRNFLSAHGVDHSHLGFASIQLDGGIEKVTAKVARWFGAPATSAPSPLSEARGEGRGEGRRDEDEDARINSKSASSPRPSPPREERGFALGLAARGEVPANTAAAFAMLARAVCDDGGSVVVAQSATLLKNAAFTSPLFESPAITPTLAYAQPITKPGFHVMESAADQLVETLTGLGGCGAELLLIYAGDSAAQAHPLVPTVQVSCAQVSSEVDLVLDQPDAVAMASALTTLLARVRAGDYTPRAQAEGNVDFQVSRGQLGVST